MALQKGWNWCHRCSELIYTSHPSTCSRGGEHDVTGSGAYLAHSGAAAGAQSGWRWCRRCGAMYYGGVDAGRCINGGGHDGSGSGDYAISTGEPGGLEQGGWRWCSNCQVLHYAASLGACPAANGGPHSTAGSGNYKVRARVVGEGIAVAFQGKGDDGTLWLLLRQNGQWSAPVRVPGGCSNTPSPIQYKGVMYIFYQGMGNSKELWYTSFDGSEFSASTKVPDVRLKGGPSAVVHDTAGWGSFVEVWLQGTAGWTELWRVRWMPPHTGFMSYRVPDVAIMNDPAAVSLPDAWPSGGGTIAVAEAATKEPFHVTKGTGVLAEYRHRGRADFEIHNSAASPGAVVYKNKLYVFHEDSGSNGELWYSTVTYVNKGTASAGVRVPNVGISGKPVPVVEGNTLHVFHEGMGDNGELWCVSTSDGVNWGADRRIQGVGVSDSCGATSFKFDP